MKKTWKRLVAGCLLAAMTLGAAGCGNGKGNDQQQAQEPVQQQQTEEPVTLNVMAMSGPTGMGMVKLMEDAEAGELGDLYNIAIAGAADEINGKLITGEVDIAALPCNVASVLYNKTKGDVEVAAINTLGVLYILEKGDTIHSVADLAGKTIVSTGKANTPEYVLNYLLSANGLDPQKDVTVEYKTEAAEIASAFQQGQAEIAMVPQPVATTILAKNADVRTALDVTEEWTKAQGEDAHQLVTGVIVVRKAVAEEHPEAVQQFLTDYQASIDYINNNVEDGAALVEKFGIVPSAAIAQKAIPQCNIVYMDGQEMKDNVQAYLKVLFDANPASVGGAMPNDDFYYLP